MTARTRKRIGLALGLGLLVLVIAYGFRRPVVTVETAVVERGPLQMSVEEEGRTRVRDRFTVSAPVGGYVRRSTWRAGDAVRKGEVLFTIEPVRSAALDPRSRAEAEARVRAARAALQAARENAGGTAVEARLAATSLERTRALHQAGSATTQQLDQAETAARRAQAAQRAQEAAVEVATFQLQAAESALHYAAAPGGAGQQVLVRAPVPGALLRLYRESEGVVQPGEPLADLGDARALELVTEVLSADAVRMAPGTRVQVERWGGEVPLEAVVRRVEPAGHTRVSALGVEEQRVQVISDLTSPPSVWQRLGDGYRVVTRFVLWERAEVLRLPTSAVFRHGEGWAVFVVTDGNTARLQPVGIGHRSGLYAEVVSGLEAGAQVVVHPDDALADGARVRVRAD